MSKISLRAYDREINDLIENKRSDEVIAHCKHILISYPKHIETYRLLGRVYIDVEQFNEASDIFQRILSAIPDDFSAQVGMGAVREAENNLDAAIWHIERAFEVQPSNPTIQNELRRLYQQRDNVTPPKMRLTRGALVRMYARGELYPQAVTEARAVLEEEPQRIDIKLIQAQMHYQLQQKSEAVDLCSSIIQKAPYCFEANKMLSVLLPEFSKVEEAETHRHRMFELDPYTEYVDQQYPSGNMVPDEAVMLEKLVYQEDAVDILSSHDMVDAIEQVPDWMEEAGFSIGEDIQNKDEFPFNKTEWIDPSPLEEINLTHDISQPSEASASSISGSDPVEEGFAWLESLTEQTTENVDIGTILPADDDGTDAVQAEKWIPQDVGDDELVLKEEPDTLAKFHDIHHDVDNTDIPVSKIEGEAMDDFDNLVPETSSDDMEYLDNIASDLSNDSPKIAENISDEFDEVIQSGEGEEESPQDWLPEEEEQLKYDAFDSSQDQIDRLIQEKFDQEDVSHPLSGVTVDGQVEESEDIDNIQMPAVSTDEDEIEPESIDDVVEEITGQIEESHESLEFDSVESENYREPEDATTPEMELPVYDESMLVENENGKLPSLASDEVSSDIPLPSASINEKIEGADLSEVVFPVVSSLEDGTQDESDESNLEDIESLLSSLNIDISDIDTLDEIVKNDEGKEETEDLEEWLLEAEKELSLNEDIEDQQSDIDRLLQSSQTDDDKITSSVPGSETEEEISLPISENDFIETLNSLDDNDTEDIVSEGVEIESVSDTVEEIHVADGLIDSVLKNYYSDHEEEFSLPISDLSEKIQGEIPDVEELTELLPDFDLVIDDKVDEGLPPVPSLNINDSFVPKWFIDNIQNDDDAEIEGELPEWVLETEDQILETSPFNPQEMIDNLLKPPDDETEISDEETPEWVEESDIASISDIAGEPVVQIDLPSISGLPVEEGISEDQEIVLIDDAALPEWIKDTFDYTFSVDELNDDIIEPVLPSYQEAGSEWIPEIQAIQSNQLISHSENDATYANHMTLPPLHDTENSQFAEASNNLRESDSQYSIQSARKLLDKGNLMVALEHYNHLVLSGSQLLTVIEDMENIVKHHPFEASVWQSLGDAYAKNNQLKLALDAYSKAEDLLH